MQSRLGPIDVCVDNAMVTILSPVALSQPEEVRRVTEATCLLRSTVAAIWGNRLIAPLLDRHLARSAYRAQLAPEPIEPNRPDNMREPVPGDRGARGRFTGRSRTDGGEPWLATHRTRLLAGCVAGASHSHGGVESSSRGT